MKKVSLMQRRRTEKAIIDALLKISEIVQKTENSRQRQKSLNLQKNSKKTIGDGDGNSFDDEGQQKVPVPPSMRTLESNASEFNQESLDKPLNSNHLSIDKSKQNSSHSSWHSQDTVNQPYDQSLGHKHVQNNDAKKPQHSNKRSYDNSSSISLSSDDNHYRKKSSKYNSIKNIQSVCQEVEKNENQPTITTLNSQRISYQINSAATTILDDQSSSLNVTPVNSARANLSPIPDEQQPLKNSMPLHVEEQKCGQSQTKRLMNFDVLTNRQLKEKLENHLKNQDNVLHKEINLSKSETEKLMKPLDLSKPVYNLDFYEKQRQLAMVAAQKGNYSLSNSIHTNLLHDNQYDYEIKSEILSSRATTLFLEEKFFESIDDCTQAIAYNQWNKLAYVVRAACWMIKQEYTKALDDYSKLFYLFDQSQQVLDLLNLAYEKLKSSKHENTNDEQSIKTLQEKSDNQSTKSNPKSISQLLTSSIDTSIDPNQSLSLVSPTASFMQPAVYLCYPYQAYPTWHNNNEKRTLTRDEPQQPTYMIANPCMAPQPSFIINQSSMSTEKLSKNLCDRKHRSCQSIHLNNNALSSTIQHDSLPINQNLIWIKNPYRLY